MPGGIKAMRAKTAPGEMSHDQTFLWEMISPCIIIIPGKNVFWICFNCN